MLALRTFRSAPSSLRVGGALSPQLFTASATVFRSGGLLHNTGHSRGMATKVGSGTVKNHGGNGGQRLGVKIYGHQKAKHGDVIVRQTGTKYHAGNGVMLSKNYTIHAMREGLVHFTMIKQTWRKKDLKRMYVHVLPYNTDFDKIKKEEKRIQIEFDKYMAIKRKLVKWKIKRTTQPEILVELAKKLLDKAGYETDLPEGGMKRWGSLFQAARIRVPRIYGRHDLVPGTPLWMLKNLGEHKKGVSFTNDDKDNAKRWARVKGFDKVVKGIPVWKSLFEETSGLARGSPELEEQAARLGDCRFGSNTHNPKPLENELKLVEPGRSSVYQKRRQKRDPTDQILYRFDPCYKVDFNDNYEVLDVVDLWEPKPLNIQPEMGLDWLQVKRDRGTPRAKKEKRHASNNDAFATL